MASRIWAEYDLVAVRDRVDQPWTLGTITGIRPAGHLVIRLDGIDVVDIRHPDDVRLRGEHEVPVDERHWLPEKVRDQLVRQEAAGRLLAMWQVFPGGAGFYDDLAAAAVQLENFLSDEGPLLAFAARVLLNPAPAPAATP